MVDALGLAETTPGPLILVTQFVGFLGAMRLGGGDPWLMGALGAATTTWATFAPCFLWIFVGAPYIERLHAEPRLKAALAAVTAAVVGVILNLTVTFAIDVLSPTAKERWYGPLKLYLPDLTALSWLAAALSAVAIVLTFRLHRNIILGPLGHRPVSHPRSSNRTCRFPASGFPTGFTARHATGPLGASVEGTERRVLDE